MTDVKVDEIFDCAFVSVTKKLTSLVLQRKVDGDLSELRHAYKGSVITKGKFESMIVCEFSPGIFEYIISIMNGDLLPSEDEKVLYINEYINIVCGRALSEINNVLGSSSRLTVPQFYMLEEEIEVEKGTSEKNVLYYESDAGSIRISVYHTINVSGKRRVTNG